MTMLTFFSLISAIIRWKLGRSKLVPLQPSSPNVKMKLKKLRDYLHFSLPFTLKARL